VGAKRVAMMVSMMMMMMIMMSLRRCSCSSGSLDR
jgi:hypothetical protein